MKMLPLVALMFVMCVFSVSAAETGDILELKAHGSARWYKGNMHTHSLWSDGDDYPEMIARWYRDHGYQFVVFTDHNTLLNKERWIDSVSNKGGTKALEKLRSAGFPKDWVQMRPGKNDALEIRLKTFDEVFDRMTVPGEFLLIQGEEVSDRFGRLPIHLCVTNTSVVLTPLGGDSVVEVMQRNVDAVLSHRARTGEAALVHLNHPNFYYAVTAEQLMQVVGENFFEVYNGHPSVNNLGDSLHASTDRQWDIINTWRLSRLDLPVMYGLATDDSHNYHREEPTQGSQPGRGWVMILSETLTPEALISSLEAGHFYSSSGVTLKSVTKTTEELSVTVNSVPGVTYTIDFIGTLDEFDAVVLPATDETDQADTITRKYSDDVGKVLKSVSGLTATYEFQGNEIFVRALITSSRRHPNSGVPGEMERAWVQPVQP